MKITKIAILCLILLGGCHDSKKPDNLKPERIIHEDWYENGNIESRVWYNENLAEDSLGIWYYENGNVRAKIRFNDGNQIGPSTYYYPDGTVELFCFYNEAGDGSVMYLQEYDGNGKVVDEKGKPIGVVFENGLRVPAKSYFDYTVICATPPNSEMIIYTATNKDSGDFINEQAYQVRDKMPFFRHFFEAKGEYPMRVISELKDTVRNEVRRDTLSFTVIVE